MDIGGYKVNKYLQESYDEALKEIGELKTKLEFSQHHRDEWEKEAVTLLNQNKSLLFIIEQAEKALAYYAEESYLTSIGYSDQAIEALQAIRK